MRRLLTLMLSGLLLTTAGAAEKPNIVLILSDDQAWNDYSFMGHDQIKTPHLDKLASQSVLFRRGYVPTALCRPSLMTLATGHYAHKHGVTGNDPFGDSANPPASDMKAALISNIDRFDTLPELLVEQGYLTHQSGKWWEGNFKRGGFTHGMTRGYPQKGGRHGDDGLKIGREGLQPIEEFVDMAVEKEKPFYLWYAPFLPHTPHNPPERLLSKYADTAPTKFHAKYYAMCEWFDETCGELVGMLEKKGLRDNTIIVYVTDNGWIQSPKSQSYHMRSKRTPYEGGIRTPIFFSWPGKYKPGDRPELVSSLDIFPTLVTAAGARMPEGLPGYDLTDALNKGAGIKRDRIFGESFAHDIADISNPMASLTYRWCIDGKWKLLLSYDGNSGRQKYKIPELAPPELYDLEADPWEKKNLAAENPELVSKMVGHIDGWYPTPGRKCLKEVK